MELTTTEFFALFFYAVSIYYPQSEDPDLKPKDARDDQIQTYYDFIIVGAGSAGCVVANRLSEERGWNILLIEAGGDEDAVSDAPLLFQYLANTEKDWNYTTVKQKYACLSTGGICDIHRGRVLGGSSTINYMLYVRGNKADYDSWAAQGNIGWSYQEVLPYFIKSENNTIPFIRNSPLHGQRGYQNVQYSRYDSPLENDFINGGLEMGWKEGDYNGIKQDVIGRVQLTLDGPSRESTSKAYLNPIRNRPNLSIIKHSQVSKIILQGNTAMGVVYYRNGKRHEVFARKEVILSAGAVDTPKLLMLSGIGPKHELQRHNIQVVADLPVGEELQDHIVTVLNLEVDSNKTFGGRIWKTNSSIFEYAKDRKGPLTTTSYTVTAFTNTQSTRRPPNIQLVWFDSFFGDFAQNKPTVLSIVVGLVEIKSRGWLKLRSNDWKDPPLINPNYLSNTDDVNALEEGLGVVLKFLKTPSIAKLRPRIYYDSYPDCKDSIENNFFRCIIHKYSLPYYHLVSTAKMGTLASKYSVVSPNLIVKGFKNLRVIDASVMPTIPRANTNGPTIMIAEKGSDLVKCSYLCN